MRWSMSFSSGALFGGRLDNLELKFSQRARDAVPPNEGAAEEGDRHARRCCDRSDAEGRRLCRCRADWNALIDDATRL